MRLSLLPCTAECGGGVTAGDGGGAAEATEPPIVQPKFFITRK